MSRGRRVGASRHHDGVFHRTSFFQLSDDASDVRLLLADSDVNIVNRAETFNADVLLVDAGLIDHRVHTDGRLARRTVADDQLALTAANRNHRVNGHDACLQRLADGFALDDAGRDFFHRIECGFLDRSLAIKRTTEGVHHATEKAFADRHGEQLARGLHLGALANAQVITQHDGADLGLFEVQRDADDAVAEVEHLVEHRLGQAFDLGHTVGDFAHGADVLPGDRRFNAGDLGFNFLENRTHSSISNKSMLSYRLSAKPFKRACTLPSYTSLPTFTRRPPIKAAFCENVRFKPAPYFRVRFAFTLS